MIAKGNLHAHGQKLAAYLITGKMDERAELVELRGFASSNIREAFIDVQIQAEATRCEKPFFHLHVRLPDGETLSREQWQHVADRIEKQLGFEGQGRAVAFHHDQRSGEQHLHVAWSRIDLEAMRSIDPGLYKNKLKEISRQLEKELGLTRVRNERDPEQKTLAPARNEFEQARRLGTDLKEIRETIRACWERSDSGRSFAAALDEKGYILARGDRRDFVVIDREGGDHALGKRIVGVAAAEIRARLADIDKRQLPGVDQAKTLQAERGRAALDRAPQKIAGEARATAAPEGVHEAEARPATSAPPEQKPAPAAPAREAGVRSAGDVAGRFAGGIAKALGAAFGALADMIAPPPPPTPEQAERQARAAQETEERAAAQRTDDELKARTADIIDDERRHKRDESDRPRYDRFTGERLDEKGQSQEQGLGRSRTR